MIKPHPESDLSLNIMVLGSEIIKLLQSATRKSGRLVFVEDLLEDFLKQDKKRTPDLFIYSLVFLYGLGMIERQGYKIGLLMNVNEEPF